MKKASIVFRLSLAVCFALVVSSCDWFDKVDDVTFDVTLSHTFHIDQTAAGDDVVYQVQELLDAAAVDSDFNKYKENIKSISVNSVTYEVQNCTTAGVIFSDGTVAYSVITVTEPDPTIAVADLGVENVKAAENQEKNLHFSQVALNDMSNLLKANKELNVYLNGTLSTTPAKFDVVLKIKATVTANTL
jgi:hypothetical protein